MEEGVDKLTTEKKVKALDASRPELKSPKVEVVNPQDESRGNFDRMADRMLTLAIQAVDEDPKKDSIRMVMNEKSTLGGVLSKPAKSGSNTRKMRLASLLLASSILVVFQSKEVLAENVAFQNAAVEQVDSGKRHSTNDLSPADRRAQEMKEAATNYIQDLGMFAKLNFVEEVKDRADAIKKSAKSGDLSELDGSGEDLMKVLKIYKDGLEEVKAKDVNAYDEALRQVLATVDNIRDKSIGQLKKEYSN